MTWKLTPGEYAATKEKIEKINARAEKRGFTGRIELTAERVEETRKVFSETGLDFDVPIDTGFTVTEVYYNVELTGEAPSYNGWKLLATLDWDSQAGLIVRTAPGVENVDRDSLREGMCDHCGSKRFRRNVHLVGNEETGEQLQVGSTCIKDFLGWTGVVVFFHEDKISDDVDDYLSGGGYIAREWTTETVLAAAWAAIQVYGYEPSSSYGATTKGRVWDILDPRSKLAREEADMLRPYLVNSYEQARIIREWVLSDEFKGYSEYVTNLKAILAADLVTERNIGFAVSAPQTWAKAQERDLIKRQEKEEISNEFVGNEKDKLELEVTIKSIRYIDGDWGTTTLYTLLSTDKHVFKWFSSSKALGETADDTVYKIRGTVKGHDEYRGLKSTILTRVKELNPLTGKPFKPALADEHPYGAHRGEPLTDCEMCVKLVILADDNE